MISSKRLWILISTFVTILVICSGCEDGSFHQSAYLDNNNKVYIQWRTNSSHLTMKVTGKTKGWLGVGFSSTGNMKGADMVIAWVKNGKTYLQDRHGQPFGNGLPPLDKQQDYTLKEGRENETHTVFCFERKLDTCDKEDYKITTDSIPVIYAFNENDPSSERENSPGYHGSNRGISSQNIRSRKYKKPTGSDVKYIDFRMPNITIPDGRDTYYWCQFFSMPEDIQTKHHVIGHEVILETGQENLMHHLAVIQCVGNNISDILKDSTGFECYTPTAPIPYLQCQRLAIAWAKGMTDTFFPDNVGYPFINEIDGQAVYYMFDVHFDNPQKKNGIRISSGLRVYYTSKLRSNDGGGFPIGVTDFNPYLIIPPGQKAFVTPGHCAKECLAATLPETGIRVFGFILHTHLAGRIMKVRHFRNSTELEPLADSQHYDFNFQKHEILAEERLVLPGDSLTLECTFNTEDRNITTIGGESTRDEMCIAFLLYYSSTTLARCYSVMNPADVNDLIGVTEIYPAKDQFDIKIKEPSHLNNTPIGEYLKTVHWSDDLVVKLQERMLKSDKIAECTGATGKIDMKNSKTVNYPKTTEFKDSCTGGEA